MKMEEFFVRVAELTVRHDVENDCAVIYADKLGLLLDEIYGSSDWAYIDELKEKLRSGSLHLPTQQGTQETLDTKE